MAWQLLNSPLQKPSHRQLGNCVCLSSVSTSLQRCTCTAVTCQVLNPVSSFSIAVQSRKKCPLSCFPTTFRRWRRKFSKLKVFGQSRDSYIFQVWSSTAKTDEVMARGFEASARESDSGELKTKYVADVIESG